MRFGSLDSEASAGYAETHCDLTERDVVVCCPRVLSFSEPRRKLGQPPTAAQLPPSSARHNALLLSPRPPTKPTLLLRPPRGESPPAPMAPTVEISHLSFTYPGIDGRPPPGAPPLIEDVCFSLDAGQRCLLLGSNGAGSPNYPRFSTVPLLRFSRPFRC